MYKRRTTYVTSQGQKSALGLSSGRWTGRRDKSGQGASEVVYQLNVHHQAAAYPLPGQIRGSQCDFPTTPATAVRRIPIPRLLTPLRAATEYGFGKARPDANRAPLYQQQNQPVNTLQPYHSSHNQSKQ